MMKNFRWENARQERTLKSGATARAKTTPQEWDEKCLTCCFASLPGSSATEALQPSLLAIRMKVRKRDNPLSCETVRGQARQRARFRTVHSPRAKYIRIRRN